MRPVRWGNPAVDGDAQTPIGRAQVNPAALEGRISVLPWEIYEVSPDDRSRGLATAWMGREKSADAIIVRATGRRAESDRQDLDQSMDVKRQQGGATRGPLRRGPEGCVAPRRQRGRRHRTWGGFGARRSAAWDHERALTRQLMEEVTGSANLNRAYKRVKANGGAAGVDGMSVTELRAWITPSTARR